MIITVFTLSGFLTMIGYLVADVKLEFDEIGNIKNNYRFNGFVKDG